MATTGLRHRRQAGARKSFLAYCRSMGNSALSTQMMLSSKHMDNPGPMRLVVMKQRRWLLRIRTAQALRGIRRVRPARIRRAIRNIDYRNVAVFSGHDAATTDWSAVFKKTEQSA